MDPVAAWDLLDCGSNPRISWSVSAYCIDPVGYASYFLILQGLICLFCTNPPRNLFSTPKYQCPPCIPHPHHLFKKLELFPNGTVSEFREVITRFYCSTTPICSASIAQIICQPLSHFLLFFPFREIFFHYVYKVNSYTIYCKKRYLHSFG